MHETRRLGALAPALLALALFACSKPGTQSPTVTYTPAQASAGEVSANEVQRVSGSMRPTSTEIRNAVELAYQKAGGEKGGKVADYIPELAKVDPNLFGIVVVTVDGEVYQAGDTTHPFSIQSAAKPFTLARLLEDLGPAEVAKRVGPNATGQPFNSIIAIELNKSQDRPPPGNPFVKPGAIASVALVPAHSMQERWSRIIDTFGAFAGRKLTVDQPVYQSESATNTRNRSIAWLLTNYEVIPDENPLPALDLYTRECAVAVSAKDLAIMGATLANGGVNPMTGKRVVSTETAGRVLSVMMTAGMYENSGTWSYDFGIPAKSGVGGGIVAVVPGRFAVATFAPALDEAGNSVKGQKAIGVIAQELGANMFVPHQVKTAKAGHAAH